jgi:hypothetical protein
MEAALFSKMLAAQLICTQCKNPHTALTYALNQHENLQSNLRIFCSNHTGALQVGGWTCRWQRHSVKPSCWECSTTVEQAKTHLRVVVPIEEEEESYRCTFHIPAP